MRAYVALSLLAATSLVADTREVIRTTSPGTKPTLEAQYFKGKNVRIDELSEEAQPVQARITNFDRQSLYELDLASKEYVELRAQGTGLMLSLAHWIRRPQRPFESGKTVNIYYDTVDLGESREFFGHTARHFLLRERHVAESGACDPSQERERNGWYLPRGEGLSYRQITYGLVLANSCHDTVIKHGDPSLPGFPIVEDYGWRKREVLELSDAPLDAKLFDPPPGFRKVETLPGWQAASDSQSLAMEWQQLVNAFASWFN